jgi:hypothetical protein
MADDNDLNQAEFKRFSKQVNQLRREQASDRTKAVGTMTPDLMRKHLRSGQDLVLDYGKQGMRLTYTLADLQRLAREADARAKDFGGGGRGAPIPKLLAASRQIDIDRANNRVSDGTGISRSNLFAIRGDTLHFRVTASESSKDQYHQVRIRIEGWDQAITSLKPYAMTAKEIATTGRVSFDCDCGRHQFWYRYIATIGGFALKPVELALPKIRNPKLDGACCKHTLKSLISLRSGIGMMVLAKELERQSSAVAFGGDPKKSSRYLKKEELQKAARTRQKIADKDDAEKAWKDFQRVQKAFARKQKEPSAKKAQETLRAKTMEKLKTLSMEKRAAEHVAKTEIAARRKLETDMKTQWVGTLKTIAATGVPLAGMIDNLAANTGADKAMLLQIAKDEGLI